MSPLLILREGKIYLIINIKFNRKEYRGYRGRRKKILFNRPIRKRYNRTQRNKKSFFGKNEKFEF